MNVINEQGAGGSLGSSLGSGISRTLDMLTNSHLNKIAERHQFENNQRGLNALGANPELAYLPQKLQQLAVKNQLESGNRENLAKALSGLLTKEQQPIAETLAGLSSKDQIAYMAELNRQEENKKRDIDRDVRRNLLEQKTISDIESKKASDKLRESEVISKRGARQSKINSEENKLNLSKERELNKIKISEQKEVNKQNKEYNQSLDNQLRTLPTLEKKVRRAKEIISSGKAGSRVWGYLPTALQGNESQELEGLSSDILSTLGENTKTDAERKTLEKSKISLNQSQPAQMKAVERLDDIIKLIKAQDKIRSRLIKENGGNQPANLPSLVQQELEKNPKLINLRESMSKELSKDKILELPLGKTFQGKDNQWYTRVKYGSGVRPATSEEVNRNSNV